jgi:hydrogenase large subunit
MSAVFGGKQPHQSSIIPTGVTLFPSQAQRALYRQILDELTEFVNTVYVPDVLSLGTNELFELAKSDIGVGYQNYLSYGGFEENQGHLLYPAGVVVNGILLNDNLNDIESKIAEDVSHAWYKENSSGHPNISKQEFNLDKQAYSFVKAPRYNNQPMEVGPLARMIITAKQTNHPTFNHSAAQKFIELFDYDIKTGIVARHAARALETQILCDAMYNWLDELEELASESNTEIQDKEHWTPPLSGQGIGMNEAPRGSLGHWISVANSRIENYACVVPTTWNASPKDSSGFNGPIEEALFGCPVSDTENPINIGRVVRSFDPCLACAVHILTPDGNINSIKI